MYWMSVNIHRSYWKKVEDFELNKSIHFGLQKNAMIGGALTGALVSAASNNNRDKIVMDAMTGGAVATASEFLNYLT